jgi:NitT/TauT family transport system ATP-binding protein
MSQPRVEAALGRPGAHVVGEIDGEPVVESRPPKEPERGRVPVLELRGVTKIFLGRGGRSNCAIRSVSLVVEDIEKQGEVLAILGPSGCGKSTILNLVAGLRPHHPPTQGQVLVGGAEVGGPGADRGMVFQAYTSFPHLTVLENVGFGLRLRGVPRDEREERAREWVARVGLSGHEDKYPHQVSGGQQQRIAIARTLICRPKVLLMDEPFGALDPATRREMQECLLGIYRDPSVEVTIVLVTHSVAEAAYLATKIVLMKANPGEIVKYWDLPPPSRPYEEVRIEEPFQRLVREIEAHLQAKDVDA